jgi:hypothetical protein
MAKQFLQKYVRQSIWANPGNGILKIQVNYLFFILNLSAAGLFPQQTFSKKDKKYSFDAGKPPHQSTIMGFCLPFIPMATMSQPSSKNTSA